MKPLAVVAWKWGGLYTPEHVNRFARMVRRNLRIDHDFFVLTDDAAGIDPGACTALPIPIKHSGTHRANRRVEILSSELRRGLGARRVLQLDLDLVVLSDVTDLCEGWAPPTASYWHPGASYNPSFFLLPDARDDRPVAAPDHLRGWYPGADAWLDACWRAFDADPKGTFQRALDAGWSRGCSDQAIINWWMCGPSSVKRSDACAELDHRHGLYAYKRMSELQRVHPPIQARIVFFTGKAAQDALFGRAHHWIAEALR